MMTKMWSQRRTMWIATGAGIVMLTLGSWFMTGLERHQVLPPDEKTSDQSQTEQKERSLQGMPMSPSQETGPPQAYAMVTPTKQQLIGVKTAVVETRPLETTVCQGRSASRYHVLLVSRTTVLWTGLVHLPLPERASSYRQSPRGITEPGFTTQAGDVRRRAAQDQSRKPSRGSRTGGAGLWNAEAGLSGSRGRAF